MPRSIPKYPSYMDLPFSESGDKVTIETTTTNLGKASLTTGFPPECSLPLDDGGIPPSRTDMNGLFHHIYSWLFYIGQSGGMTKWDSTVNYIVPALIYHNGVIYTCKTNNGPGTPAGVKTPGDAGSENYWEVGLGSSTNSQSNIFGNNANLYLKTGIYFINNAQATTNYPVPGTGGFLSVWGYPAAGTYVHQHFVCHANPTKAYTRYSSNAGATWTEWTKIMFRTDFKNGAFKDIYIETTVPNDAIGADGDVWIQWR